MKSCIGYHWPKRKERKTRTTANTLPYLKREDGHYKSWVLYHYCQAAGEQLVPATELPHPFQLPPRPIRFMDAPLPPLPLLPFQDAFLPTLAFRPFPLSGLFPFFFSFYPRSTPSALTFFLEPTHLLSLHTFRARIRSPQRQIVHSLSSFVLCIVSPKTQTRQPAFFNSISAVSSSSVTCLSIQSRFLATCLASLRITTTRPEHHII